MSGDPDSKEALAAVRERRPPNFDAAKMPEPAS
jgi:hypothetical protein